MSLLILVLVFLSVTLGVYALLSRPAREPVMSGAFVAPRFEASHSPSGIFTLLFPVLNALAPAFRRLGFPSTGVRWPSTCARRGSARVSPRTTSWRSSS